MRPQHRPQPGRRAPGAPGAAANVSSCSRSNAVVRSAAWQNAAMQEPEFSTTPHLSAQQSRRAEEGPGVPPHQGEGCGAGCGTQMVQAGAEAGAHAADPCAAASAGLAPAVDPGPGSSCPGGQHGAEEHAATAPRALSASSATDDVEAMLKGEEITRQKSAEEQKEEDAALDALIAEETALLSTQEAASAGDRPPQSPAVDEPGDGPDGVAPPASGGAPAEEVSKAEKAAIIAAFMKAADKLAMCELLKALRGSKWRFNLFELVQAGTCSLRSVKARLADANEGQNVEVNGLLDSADLNEFRTVPDLGLETLEDSRRAVILRFCHLWFGNLEAVEQEMHAICLQMSIRCWRARRRLRTRRNEHAALLDGLSRYGLQMFAERLCRELDIQNFEDVGPISNDRLLQVTWLNAQLRQRFRHFQNTYGKALPGSRGFSRTSSQGFSRTTSLAEYCRTKSTASSNEEISPQRAQSLESSSPAAAGGAASGAGIGAGRDLLQKPSAAQPVLGFKRTGSLAGQASTAGTAISRTASITRTASISRTASSLSRLSSSMLSCICVHTFLFRSALLQVQGSRT